MCFLVVWQPGDSAMVEWPVAEWRLCIICGVPWGWLCRANLEHGKNCTFKEKLCLSAASDRHGLVSKPVLTLLSAWLQKDQIVLYDVHKVFAVDALASSHPLSRRAEEVNDPSQISEMFNTISYSKVCPSARCLYRIWQTYSPTFKPPGTNTFIFTHIHMDYTNNVFVSVNTNSAWSSGGFVISDCAALQHEGTIVL